MGKIREWPVSVSNLPCACEHCLSNPDNNLCVYAPWRKTRTEVMKEAIHIPNAAASVEVESNVEEMIDAINA